MLNLLNEAEFISKRSPLGKHGRDFHYYLKDEYIRFYNKWGMSSENPPRTFAAFQRILDSQSYKIFSGFNFEMLCFAHEKNIAKSLGLSGISPTAHIYYEYDDVGKKPVAQIDFLFNRPDNCITICDAKFYDSEYKLTKNEIDKMIHRRESLKRYLAKKSRSKNLKKIFNFCIVHLNGVAKNNYYQILSPALVPAKHLFEPL